jgi:hypothetical protein
VAASGVLLALVLANLLTLSATQGPWTTSSMLRWACCPCCDDDVDDKAIRVHDWETIDLAERNVTHTATEGRKLLAAPHAHSELCSFVFTHIEGGTKVSLATKGLLPTRLELVTFRLLV